MKRTLVLALVLAGLTAGACGVGARAGETPSASPDVETTRAALARWIETQQIIAKERKDWERTREILRARIEAAAKEAAELEGRVAEARKAATETAGRRGGLAVEEGSLKATASGLGEKAGALEARLRTLRRSLPEPLAQKLDPLFLRMPEDPGASRISVAERLQNVLGILNEFHKANNEITLVSEVRTLSGGKPSEVKTVYVGLGQAYYLGARGEAGTGVPGPEGWVFRPADPLAREIGQVVEILQGQGSPRFVALPVEIR